MTTWFRARLNASWHVSVTPVTQAGSSEVATTLCGLAQLQVAQRHEGGRPRRERVCRDCWYMWDQEQRDLAAKAAKAEKARA